MFARWQKYVAKGTIKGIDLGVSLIFLEGTPLENQIKEHAVFFLNSDNLQPGEKVDPVLWQSDKNKVLTVPERIRRRIEVHREAIKYNWPIWRGTQRLKNVWNLLVKYEKIKLKIDPGTSKICTSGLHFID